VEFAFDSQAQTGDVSKDDGFRDCGIRLWPGGGPAVCAVGRPAAIEAGCTRLWLVTTNNNLRALEHVPSSRARRRSEWTHGQLSTLPEIVRQAAGAEPPRLLSGRGAASRAGSDAVMPRATRKDSVRRADFHAELSPHISREDDPPVPAACGPPAPRFNPWLGAELWSSSRDRLCRAATTRRVHAAPHRSQPPMVSPAGLPSRPADLPRLCA
jgi:hypothetical protein